MLDQLLDIDNLVRPVRLVGLAGSTMAIDGLTGVQPTLALAATAPDSALNDADTQIFGSTALSAGVSATGSANSGPIDGATGSVKVLATSSAKRKRRGGWLFVIILILALVAGGGGWYFGSGPGSQVTLPTLVSSTPEEAASQLAALGLEVVLGEEFSGTIDQGLVSSTLPAAGQSVTKGSTVTVNVSQGLQPITLPVLAGLSRDDAFAAVTALNALVGAEDDVFSDSVPAGQVIAATRDSDGAEVSSGGEYFEGLAVSFLVSLGPVPNVAGQSVADASRTLGAVGLETQVVEERFSNDVARGIVISAGASADGPVRTGDTISLVVSKGEDLVEVPDVIDGQTVADAREQLEDLGFSVKSNVPGFLEGGVIARVQTPEAGSMARRGSEISVNF
jgi:serine/threonine-protein kinase